MRLFVAVELPDNIKRKLGKLRMEIPGARWVPVDRIHLTLAFLGEVEDTAVEQLTVEFARIHVPAFQLSFSGTGCFPDRRRPGVLWIGLEPEPRLMHLADRIHAAVSACGISRDGHPFSPHITLARLKTPAPEEAGLFLDQNKNLKLPLFRVGEFTLFQSRLTPQGAVHSPIRSFLLSSRTTYGI